MSEWETKPQKENKKSTAILGVIMTGCASPYKCNLVELHHSSCKYFHIHSLCGIYWMALYDDIIIIITISREVTLGIMACEGAHRECYLYPPISHRRSKVYLMFSSKYK